jgi:predicted amidohydrolase
MRTSGLAALALWLSFALALGAAEPPLPPQTMRVAAVQMRSARNLEANVEATRRSIAACARQGARVVVFPECSVSGYFDSDYMKSLTAERLAAAERAVAEACREHQVYAIVGLPVRDGTKLYNSALVIDPKGRVLERYHKLQLAESWPDAGDHLSVFPIDGVLCSIIICHDERYPELVRLPVLAGSRVVFYVSHESGLDRPDKINPYRAQIQARAVENGVYVVQANAPANADGSGSHGQSRVIAPDGNLVDEADVYGEGVVLATLRLDQSTGRLAENSVRRGPLGDWWRAGVKQVRIVPAP